MKALLTLIRYAMQNIDEMPAQQQAEIYDALGELLPNNEVRIAANRLAFSIRETNKLQLDFTKQLNASGRTGASPVPDGASPSVVPHAKRN